MAVQTNTIAAQIDNGAALSAAIALNGNHVDGIVLPAAWTAAALTFQVSLDGSTFYDLYDTAGSEISFTVTAGKALYLPASTFHLRSWDWIKLRSGTTGTPVNQGGNRAFTLMCRRYL